MSSRGYQKHNMIVTTESKFVWGGTDYYLLGVNTGTTVPTGLSTSVSTGESRHNLPSVTDKTFTKTFIIPTVFDAVSIISGIAEGTLKLGAYSPTTGGNAGNYIDITKAELALRSIDSTGATRTLHASAEIWSGSVKSTKQDLITKQFLYWVNLNKIILSANERLAIDFTITYSVFTAFSNDDFTASIYCTLDTDETIFTIPFVM